MYKDKYELKWDISLFESTENSPTFFLFFRAFTLKEYVIVSTFSTVHMSIDPFEDQICLFVSFLTQECSSLEPVSLWNANIKGTRTPIFQFLLGG